VAEGLGFTKVKIVLKTTKLMCKAALSFGVISMLRLNIELESSSSSSSSSSNNNNNIRCGNLYN